MPSLTKIASYHDVTLSPRRKGQSRFAATRPDPGVTLPTSAVPTLPDVHTSSQQWSFLHTLLAHDKQERDEGVTDRRQKDKSNSYTDHSKREKHRLSQSLDQTQTSRQRDSSPTAPLNNEYADSGTMSARGDLVSDYSDQSRRQRKSTVTSVTAHSVRVSQPSVPGVISPDKLTGTVTTTHTPDMKRPSEAAALSSQRADNNNSKRPSRGANVGDKTSQPDASLVVSHNNVSHWTTCRALEDSDDEEEVAEDENDDEDALGQSKTSDAWSQELSRFGEGSVTDGLFSRATSTTNFGKRKRPLLLPPIMLPPIYTVKPTPLRLRDEVYLMGTGNRRPMTDDEWEKLGDCRYLRIRTHKRPLRV